LKKAEKVSPRIEEKPAPPSLVIEKPEEEKKLTEEGLPVKVYTGRKLSLDFKDADIKNILRLIAEVSNLNVIAGDDVTGKITMRLVDVPWDQALDIILQTKNLGMSRVGNVIRIAPSDTLKKEIQAELEAKRAKEKLEDLSTELITVNYATAKDLVPQIKHVLSDRGDIQVDERTNILIVKDIAKNIVIVRNLVKSLDTKTPQILIEARIVEATKGFQRELGIKWGFLIEKDIGGTATSVGGGIADTTLGTATREAINLPAVARAGVPGSVATAGILEAIFSNGSLSELDIAISAHENDGDVKVVSSPKIATLDNKEASIEQGLRIPYPKLTTEGTVTTDFIDANLKLTVTPHVTNDGNIKMSIKAKKDAPDFTQTVLGVPSIDKKEAITEVLVKDNGIVAIGGIYTIEKTNAAEGVPLFNKIPLLGWLFKREVKEDTRKDLLIFISPKISKDQI
jgi:type IV pilus assembly protein PilQ